MARRQRSKHPTVYLLNDPIKVIDVSRKRFLSTVVVTNLQYSYLIKIVPKTVAVRFFYPRFELATCNVIVHTYINKVVYFCRFELGLSCVSCRGIN